MKRLKVNVELSTDPEWLARVARDDEGDCVSAGGFACRHGVLDPSQPSDTKGVIATLVQLRRRELGLTVERLALDADVDQEEVVAIERGFDALPETRTIVNLANALKLPPKRLLQLSGLTKARDSRFETATLRFAAISTSIQRLTEDERKVLDEYVKVMSEQ